MLSDFNFGEYFRYDSSRFFLDLITSFVGAFFGFLFALYLNRCAEKKIKKSEIQKRNERYLDKLEYLALYIESVLDTTIKQIGMFKEFSLKVKDSPYSIHLPELLATYDFERLKNFSSNELLEAFIYLDSSNGNNIKDYKNIFSHADYLFRIFQEYEKRNEKHQLFIHKDQLFVLECFENISLKLGLRSKNIQLMNPDNYQENLEYIYLNLFDNKYFEIVKGEVDFKRINDEYFQPLHGTIFVNISNQIFADLIFLQLKKAMYRLIKIEANSSRFAKEFNDGEDDVMRAVNYLTSIKEMIKILTCPNM